MLTQIEKGKRFSALHKREGAFLIPNPWDVGSARILAGLGFEALATTSAGYAFSLGQRDSTVGRETIMAHVAAVTSATDLPVSADLGNGFGDNPETVAETIRMAAEAGAVGGSIEDVAGGAEPALLELSLAVERIQAAAETVRSLPFEFMLTARAESYLIGSPDIVETIRRLQAYRQAGANVVYAPGLTSRREISAVVNAVDCPVNVLAGLRRQSWGAAELSTLGVRRISVGSALARTAYGSLLRVSKAMRHTGAFGALQGSVSYQELNELFPA